MTIRRSMTASRRTVPIPPDFKCVAGALDGQIPNDELRPYRNMPETNPPLLPTPPPEDVFHKQIELPSELLGPELDGTDQRRRQKHIPSSLPAFPSTHTYRATPVYPTRVKDPRHIRELATEEGKISEQALRKLAGAMKLENAIHTEPELKESAAVFRMQNFKRRRKPAVSEETMFEEITRDLLSTESVEDQKEFEVGPVVSAEKKYWRPDDTPVKRRTTHPRVSMPIAK